MMDFGVTITGGVSPWQIFQQNERGTATIRVFGNCRRVHLSQELPLQFSRVETGKITVKARVALESSGENIVPWTLCQVTNDETWEIVFDAVPAGGPYRIETYMDYEGWDGLSTTRGDMVHHVGVGDVFVIAGQSNAAGRAKDPIEDAPEIGVHLLRDSGVWDLAAHPLGETTGSVHLGHFENHNPGHTPWLHFAKILKRTLGYPIGLVMSAYGGSPLRWWNPAENGALTTNMLEQLSDYDLHPKAMLWYQGEAEGFENSAETYLARFSSFVDSVRASLHQPELPVITFQLNRQFCECDLALDRQWGIVRQAQRDAMHQLKNVYTLATQDVAMYDFIHNGAGGNLTLGERAAKCALATLYGKQRDWKAPEVTKAVRIMPDAVELHFDEIKNWINPFDPPASLLPFEAEDEKGFAKLVSYETKNDSLVLHFDRPLESGAVLHGSWRSNPGQVVPWDCMRFPMLAFYALPLTNA
ncbi:MAG: sialate O-acetylesterase [Clostridiaceae bacterium]